MTNVVLPIDLSLLDSKLVLIFLSILFRIDSSIIHRNILDGRTMGCFSTTVLSSPPAR